jgi:hypothetical protein
MRDSATLDRRGRGSSRSISMRFAIAGISMSFAGFFLALRP